MSKNLFLLVSRALTLLLILSLEGLPEENYTLPKDPLKGQELFIDKGCIKCHSIQGVGGKIGPDLGKGGFNRSLIQIAGIMWNHSPKMSEKMRELKIPRPKFEVTEMADLIAYLYYLNYFDEPGNPLKGKLLFKEKECIKCHSIVGEGEDIGPSLDKTKYYVSPISMAQTMWNHGLEMNIKMKELSIGWPTFEGNEIVDIISYVQATSKAEVKERVYILPGSPQEGKRLFSEKGCIRCHSIRGEGGNVGPELSKRGLRRSATQIAGTMWNHGPNMWKKMKEIGIPRPKFSGKEMADLIAYLYFINYFDKPGNPQEGKKLFAQKGCITCHSIRGEGGNVGPLQECGITLL
jgi:cytochrome c2